ncbi:hypothetical protein [Mycoplasma simbae]|uniref:hypothetical protein n=1 Tax=Mycoplasma simbae TaxID=36744 RepID=UPI000497B16D|nr:hypothetical protein [Mycoplasma simbae]
MKHKLFITPILATAPLIITGCNHNKQQNSNLEERGDQKVYTQILNNLEIKSDWTNLKKIYDEESSFKQLLNLSLLNHNDVYKTNLKQSINQVLDNENESENKYFAKSYLRFLRLHKYYSQFNYTLTPLNQFTVANNTSEFEKAKKFDISDELRQIQKLEKIGKRDGKSYDWHTIKLNAYEMLRTLFKRNNDSNIGLYNIYKQLDIDDYNNEFKLTSFYNPFKNYRPIESPFVTADCKNRVVFEEKVRGFKVINSNLFTNNNNNILTINLEAKYNIEDIYLKIDNSNDNNSKNLYFISIIHFPSVPSYNEFINVYKKTDESAQIHTVNIDINRLFNLNENAVSQNYYFLDTFEIFSQLKPNYLIDYYGKSLSFFSFENNNESKNFLYSPENLRYNSIIKSDEELRKLLIDIYNAGYKCNV